MEGHFPASDFIHFQEKSKIISLKWSFIYTSISHEKHLKYKISTFTHFLPV